MSAVETIRIDVPRSIISDAIMAHLDRATGAIGIAPKATRIGTPIGATLQGGVFAGHTLFEDRMHALILLPAEAEEMNWKDACAWADKQGGVLPSRFDHLVLFTNLKSEFTEAWYWSSDTHAADPDYAWVQSFGNGSQRYDLKGNDYRARAVRRLVIE